MQFINDWIHLTKIEFMIKYWWLELIGILIVLVLSILSYHKKKTYKPEFNWHKKVNK